MIECALVFDTQGRVIRYHLPPGRTAGSIPDSHALWDVLWKHRKIVGGVAHTHPWHGQSAPSSTDLSTFRAIEQGLGQLLLWPIVTFTEVRSFVWDSATKAYVEAGPLTFTLEGVERLRELSLERWESDPRFRVATTNGKAR